MNLFIQQSFMAEINVSNKDEVFIKVDCDDGIAKEVAEYLPSTFLATGLCLRLKVKCGMVRYVYSTIKQD